MRGKSKVLGAVTALALTVAPAATAAAAPPAGNAPQKAADEVTLVTGDKVLLGHDRQVVAIQPGEGRENMIFKTLRTANGHTVVVPKDAFEPLAAGRLDRRLFDVTTLLEFGYRDRMPLIVDGHARVGARSSGDWAALRAQTATGDKIWLDGIRKPSLDRSVAQIGAPAAHQKGITGKGVKVAIVDTGVDEKHPDLAGQQIAEKNFTTDPDNTDNVGHGTHVGSTVASHDAKYGGVAPGAQLIDAKVCVEFGCQESWILDGMRWAAEQGAQVVNMSLGGGDTPEVDPLEQAVNDLTAQYGTLFVIAAGNSGSPGSVSSPSTAEAALSVGAVDRDDKLAPFSSKGPRVGDSGLKPEVTAPGVGIVAAKAGTADHFAASGTSMATPHVAGAAALLRQQHPEWTPAQLKSVLATTAKPTEGLSAFDQGAGRIDVAKAIGQVLTADVVAVNLGLHEWPHADDKPVTKPITYTNPTDAAITLDLAFKGSAPAGMFTLGASKVTVPAKGTASVTVTGDSRAGTRDAAYSGEVVATSGTHTVRTLVGIDREVESYTLTIDMIGRDGQDPADSFSFILGLDNDVFKPVSASGDVKIRLPKGTYFIDTSLSNGPQGLDLLYQPTVKVTSDLLITQDARQARPVSVKAPEPVGDFAVGVIAFKRELGGRGLQSTFFSFGGFDGIGIAQAGGPLPPDEFSSIALLHANTLADPHTFYRLAYPVAGGLPVGLDKAPRKEELAKVESTIGGLKPDSAATKGEFASSAQDLSGGTALYPVAFGATTTEYLSAEGVRWQSLVSTQHANGAQERVTSGYRNYKAGKTYRERELRPVFSPGLPESPYGFVERYGTQFYVGVPLLSDGTHGSGSSTGDSARTALYRNGVLLGETVTPGGSFQNVPLAQGDFRAEMSIDRSSQFEFSTKVSAVWTFKSKGTEGKIDAPPLSVVRFEPKLDDNGAVPAGTLQRIGLLTQTQGDAGKVRITGVEYSHDDGKSWRRAGVVGNSALVYNPANAQWTSLKATATDAKGGTVEITVIRAYRVTAG
jgi:hypothetical protein